EGSRFRARLAMMATSKKILEQEPSEIEMLLPWHAAGTLNARDARRVDEALARDPELARQYAVIREEYAETIHLNESLGAPSARVADITTLLDNYQASIVDGAKGGMFRLQFGNRSMSKDEVAGLMRKLQSEKIVNLAVAAP